MTVRPDYGPEFGEEEEARRAEGMLPPAPGGLGERELQEHDLEDRELEYLDAEDNEARAPGKVCERCGAVITASEDVRRLPDGNWIHEVCPRHLGGPQTGGGAPDAS